MLPAVCILSLYLGNSTYAAITAIVAANAVLVAYIAVSLQEERKAQAQPAVKAESKKDK